MIANRLQTATKTYIATLAAIAVSLVIASGSWPLQLPETELPLALVFVGCMTLAWLFPLHFTFQTKLYVDTAVIMAAILLFEPPVAIVIAGGGTFLAHALRRAGRDWPQAIFNTAQSMILAATGGLLLAVAGWDPDRPAYSDVWPLLSVPFAGVVMQVLSIPAVTTVIALEAHQPIFDSWRQGFLDSPRIELIAQVSLFAIGVLSAIVVEAHPWALVLLFAPIVAVYLTLKQHHQLRQQAERAWRASEANLATTQRVAQLGNWEWDLTTGTQTWSAEAQRIVGFGSGGSQPTLEGLLNVVDEADRAAVERAIEGSQQDATPLQISYRIKLPSRTTGVVHQEAQVVVDQKGRAVRMMGTIQDVTERNALELQVANFAERERVAQELVKVRRRLSEIREEERMSLARSLHDGPVQDLIAVSYQLAALQPPVGNDRNDASHLSDCVLEDAQRELLDVVERLRGMIRDLRPAGLAEFGVAAALEGYVARLQRQSSSKLPAIFLDIVGEVKDLPPQQAISLFRIAQEALRNALRHSAANEVMLSLEKSDCWVLLEIHDDGRGFEVPPRMHTFSESGHFGLIGIVERVEQAGGTVAIESAPTVGTTISVRLPLVEPKDCDD